MAEPLHKFRPISILAKGLDALGATWYGARLQPRDFVSMGTQPLTQKGAEPPSQISAHFYCDQTSGCTKVLLGTELGFSPGTLYRWGPSPSPKGWGGGAPQSSFHVYCGQTAGWTKMVLNMEIGLSPGDCVTWGPSHLSKKEAQPPPQVLAHFCSGQTAGCIKMPLGMEAGLSPGDFVLDGDPPPLSKKEAEPPIVGPCLLWPNGWMDQDGTWQRGGPWSTPHCAR